MSTGQVWWASPHSDRKLEHFCRTAMYVLKLDRAASGFLSHDSPVSRIVLFLSPKSQDFVADFGTSCLPDTSQFLEALGRFPRCNVTKSHTLGISQGKRLIKLMDSGLRRTNGRMQGPSL